MRTTRYGDLPTSRARRKKRPAGKLGRRAQEADKNDVREAAVAEAVVVEEEEEEERGVTVRARSRDVVRGAWPRARTCVSTMIYADANLERSVVVVVVVQPPRSGYISRSLTLYFSPQGRPMKKRRD